MPEELFLQLQNARATENLLDQLGISVPVRFNVIPSVLPVAIITSEDPTRVDRLAYGVGQQNAVALENPMVQLFNPGNSGIITHADTLLITAFAAGVVTIRLHDTALTSLNANSGFRDRRIQGTPVTQTRVATNVGALGTLRMQFAVPANDVVPITIDGYLEPGQGFLVSHNTVNTRLDVSFFWEEAPRVG